MKRPIVTTFQLKQVNISRPPPSSLQCVIQVQSAHQINQSAKMSDIKEPFDKMKSEETVSNPTTEKDTNEQTTPTNKDSEQEDIEDININDDEPPKAETKDDSPIQLVEPVPVAVTEEDLQIKPIEINDDEIEEDDDNDNLHNVQEEEGDRPPLPVRKSTSTSLKENKKENNNNDNNPILLQLKDAFPNIEEKYIISVIIASQGELDPASNALLYLSNPEANKDIELPQSKKHGYRGASNTQLHQDELLAQQLDEQFNRRQQQKHGHHGKGKRTNPVHKIPREGMTPEEIELARERRQDHERRRRERMTPEERREIYGDEDEDSWSHFVEKDIPEVANVASTTLQETASKVSNWFNGVKTSWNSQQQQQQQQDQQIRGPNRNAYPNGYDYDQDQIKQQEEAFRYYERQKRQQVEEKYLPNLPERRRFNSFGARFGEQEDEDTLKNHGISLKDDELSDDEDVPPQLPRRERAKEEAKNEDDLFNEEANLSIITNETKVIPQSTYIDTPDATNEKKSKWEKNDTHSNSTPTKSNPKNKSIENDFLINTDDEL